MNWMSCFRHCLIYKTVKNDVKVAHDYCIVYTMTHRRVSCVVESLLSLTTKYVTQQKQHFDDSFREARNEVYKWQITVMLYGLFLLLLTWKYPCIHGNELVSWQCKMPEWKFNYSSACTFNCFCRPFFLYCNVFVLGFFPFIFQCEIKW